MCLIRKGELVDVLDMRYSAIGYTKTSNVAELWMYIECALSAKVSLWVCLIRVTAPLVTPKQTKTPVGVDHA